MTQQRDSPSEYLVIFGDTSDASATSGGTIVPPTTRKAWPPWKTVNSS